ncbi:MAG TPA: ABC transporter substrate-binding protein, partial [Anaerolineae bacterium]|nr:ABC transporter substrate-binding protein [Anaerolineae bacterium]
TPFDAEAVKFSFDRIMAEETRSRKAKGMMGSYSHTEVIDKYTVAVHFREPYAPFLDSASQVYLAPVSAAAVAQWGADYQLHQVGTGPFMFEEYVPNDHLTLVRYPDYDWAPDVYAHDGPAYLDEIEFRFYVDPAVRALALESGEAAVMGELPPQDAARLEGDARFQLHTVPIPGQPLQMFLNSERPPTDDERVRQALLYATDRETIINTLFLGYSPVAYGPLTAATMGYEPSVAGSYAYDPTRAGELLDEAGWVDSDGDSLRDRDGGPLVLRAYLQTWGYLPEVGQMLQSQYRQVGIDLQTQVVQYPAAVEAAAQNEHHLAPMVFFSSDPSVLDFTYLSANAEGGFNWSNVRDEELNRLLTEGVRTLDMQRRAELYSQAQVRIMDLAIVLPIRDYVNLNAASVAVRGLRFDERGWVPWLYDVYIVE